MHIFSGYATYPWAMPNSGRFDSAVQHFHHSHDGDGIIAQAQREIRTSKFHMHGPFTVF